MLLILAGMSIFLLVRGIVFSGREAVVRNGNLDDTKSVDLVVIRSETLATSDASTRIEYVAEEGQNMLNEETIVRVYTGGSASEKSLEELAAVREEITQELNINPIWELREPTLDAYGTAVSTNVDNVMSAVRDGNAQQIVRLQRDLNVSLNDRQEYLRSLTIDDAVLSRLYESERNVETSLSAWITLYKASGTGRVSFYMDGWESVLSPNNLDALTEGTIRAVLAGEGAPGDDARGKQGLYRFVQSSPWYVVFLVSDWNLLQGQTCTVSFDDFGGRSVQATVHQVTKDNEENLVQLQINEDIGDLIGHRTASARIGAQPSGLLVPNGAVVNQGSETGVYVINGNQQSFVPVNRLAYDENNSLVQPKTPGTLAENMRVAVQ